MLPQPDGTILVLATVTNTVTDGYDFGVLRYNANGTLDSSFGTGGEAVASFPGATAEPTGIFVQSDGKIVVAGSEDVPNEGQNAAVVRFNADGTLDTSFGSGGFVVQKGIASAAAMGEDSAGDIFVQDGNPADQPTLGEYSPAGVPDSAVTFPASSSITVSSVNGFQPNGTYAEGQSVAELSPTGNLNERDAQVVLLSLPTGAPIAGFSNPPFDYANETGQGVNGIADIAFGSNGDIVAAGARCTGNVRNCRDYQLGIARLTASGSLDSTFGAGGVTTFSFTSGFSALAIQSDGDILIDFQNCSMNAQNITTCQSSIARVLG